MYILLGGQNQVLHTKNVAIIVLLILILSMTFAFLNPTLAQTNDAQKQKAETLIKILDNDNTSIALAFSRLDAQNITVPQTAETAYNEGLAHAKEAVSLMSQQNYNEAGIEAVEAMEKFEETLKILETTSPVEPTETEVTAEEAILLNANLTRTIEQAERLENLTAKAATAGYDTVKIGNKLSEIKRHLDNVTQELNNRNLEGAAEELSTAKILLDELKEPFARLTNLVTESNTETYLREAEIRVSAAKANITLSATLTPEAKEDAITALNNSEVSLSNAKDQIKDNNIDEAIEELEEAKKWEEESSRAIAAVAATPTSVTPTNESITKTAESLTQINESDTRQEITATK